MFFSSCKSSVFKHLSAALLLLISTFCFSSKATAQWELVEYGGRDYVTAKSLAKFYGFVGAEIKKNRVWFRSKTIVLKATLGSQNFFINDVKFVLSHPVIIRGRQVLISRLDLVKLIDPVLRPKHVESARNFTRVILDPGHGGKDPGGKGPYGVEKDFALKLAKSLDAKLRRLGLSVFYTRSDDRFLTLAERVKKANSISKAIFISLHFNAGKSSAKGIETFALPPFGSASHVSRDGGQSFVNFAGNARDSENIVLATAVHASVMNDIKTIDRGIKRARWAVLTGINKPAILFEGGFLSNPEEGKKIATDAYIDKLSDSIARAVANYRRAVGK